MEGNRGEEEWVRTSRWDLGFPWRGREGKRERDEQIRGTHHSRPDARDGHAAAGHEALALEVHGQPHGQHAHADLAHGVGGLAAEEAAVDGRADDDDAAAGGLCLEVRQGGLQDGVEALDVDGLHQPEAPRGRVLDRGPPYGAGVVDEGVEAVVSLRVG